MNTFGTNRRSSIASGAQARIIEVTPLKSRAPVPRSPSFELATAGTRINGVSTTTSRSAWVSQPRRAGVGRRIVGDGPVAAPPSPAPLPHQPWRCLRAENFAFTCRIREDATCAVSRQICHRKTRKTPPIFTINTINGPVAVVQNGVFAFSDHHRTSLIWLRVDPQRSDGLETPLVSPCAPKPVIRNRRPLIFQGDPNSRVAGQRCRRW